MSIQFCTKKSAGAYVYLPPEGNFSRYELTKNYFSQEQIFVCCNFRVLISMQSSLFIWSKPLSSWGTVTWCCGVKAKISIVRSPTKLRGILLLMCSVPKILYYIIIAICIGWIKKHNKWYRYFPIHENSEKIWGNFEKILEENGKILKYVISGTF